MRDHVLDHVRGRRVFFALVLLAFTERMLEEELLALPSPFRAVALRARGPVSTIARRLADPSTVFASVRETVAAPNEVRATWTATRL